MSTRRTLRSVLLEKALPERRKVGIGVVAPTEALVAGLRRAEAYCEPRVYGAEVPGFASVASAAPEDALLSDLENGVVDAAVRGQIHALAFRRRFVRPYGASFQPLDEMVTVLEFPDGRPLLAGPVSNITAGTLEEKRKLLEASIRFCELAGLPIRIGLLAQCREEDLEELAGTPLEQVYRDTDRLVELFGDRHDVRNYGVDFEKANEDGVTILIEPNGTTCNQVVRSLCFLDAVRFFGCPYMGARHVVVETFRNARDFPDVLLLAAALANSSRGEKGGNAPWR